MNRFVAILATAFLLQGRVGLSAVFSGKAQSWASDATTLSEGDIVALEKKVAGNPKDAEGRFKILFYAIRHLDETPKPRKCPNCGRAQEQYLELIRVQPWADYYGLLGRIDPAKHQALQAIIGYAWDNAASWSPNDPRVLKNAAAYLDEREKEKAAKWRFRLQSLR